MRYPICAVTDCPTPPDWLIRCSHCGAPQGRRCTPHADPRPLARITCHQCGRHTHEKQELGQ